MRTIQIAVALLLVSLWPATSQARVIVIGIDGASWNVLDPMIEAGELPNLAALAQRGFTANLDTVEPVTSPVVWTSIATGRSPEAHGVTDFLKTRLDVRVPTIYERLAQSGVRVGLYDVLMTWPPVTLPKGFVLPGWLRRDDVVVPAGADTPGGESVSAPSTTANRATGTTSNRRCAKRKRSRRAGARSTNSSTPRSAPSPSTQSTRRPTAIGTSHSPTCRRARPPAAKARRQRSSMRSAESTEPSVRSSSRTDRTTP